MAKKKFTEDQKISIRDKSRRSALRIAITAAIFGFTILGATLVFQFAPVGKGVSIFNYILKIPFMMIFAYIIIPVGYIFTLICFTAAGLAMHRKHVLEGKLECELVAEYKAKQKNQETANETETTETIEQPEEPVEETIAEEEPVQAQTEETAEEQVEVVEETTEEVVEETAEEQVQEVVEEKVEEVVEETAEEQDNSKCESVETPTIIKIYEVEPDPEEENKEWVTEYGEDLYDYDKKPIQPRIIDTTKVINHEIKEDKRGRRYVKTGGKFRLICSNILFYFSLALVIVDTLFLVVI